MKNTFKSAFLTGILGLAVAATAYAHCGKCGMDDPHSHDGQAVAAADASGEAKQAPSGCPMPCCAKKETKA